MIVPEANRFRRRIEVAEQKTDAEGRRLCLVCELPLPRRRHSYDTDECYRRNTAAIMRRLVCRRDLGICALCGSGEFCEYPRPSRYCISTSDWEMDHIVPVAEGGGLCGLDGYRTLCVPCHKIESAKLAARLAERRKAQPPLFAEARA